MTTHSTPATAPPAVVLLHSSMSSKGQWSELIAQHGAGFRFIAVDLLGYGTSPFPADAAGAGGGFTLGHEVDAVNAAIAGRLAPDEPYHLVGHSYGGATALRLARQMRPRVLSLAVYEPVAFHLLEKDDAARVEIEAVVAGIHGAARGMDAARTFIDYWNRPGAFDALPEAQRRRFAAQIDKVKLDFEALLAEPATLADMAELDMPALVLSGLASPLSTRRVAERLAAALPNAAAVATRGGHMAPLTHAAIVNPLIASFLVGEEVDA
ncbi:alpha/beta fold hydrolase [Pseudoduganella namucuonensis]|uniref:Pimeloyl-ACP methyl ester carboxylesterase n=1 Tax=Pseudoduganella namucuonensis TaxID=1035707 RepID=A0A1I7IAP9_9BURK|nr:alpha/beta hydrolase [Pseudoduganella namucuonensis]SFU70017.1 Pimeloyl-ACP methyl ester carboxylesterase [Pseudoduganella namucuonensis]